MRIVEETEFKNAKELFEFLSVQKINSIGVLSEKEVNEEVYIYVTSINQIDYGRILISSKETGKIESIETDVLVINKEIVLEPEYAVFRLENPDEGVPEYFLYSDFIFINKNDDGKTEPIKIMVMN